jgi:hypothetical protein
MELNVLTLASTGLHSKPVYAASMKFKTVEAER